MNLAKKNDVCKGCRRAACQVFVLLVFLLLSTAEGFGQLGGGGVSKGGRGRKEGKEGIPELSKPSISVHLGLRCLRSKCAVALCSAPQLVKEYVASGRLEKEVDFSVDDKILAQVGAQ